MAQTTGYNFITMNGIILYLNKAYAAVAALNPDLLMLIALCAYGGIFFVALAGCAASDKIRAADKRPFLGFTNAFTAIIFAAFMLRFELAPSALFSALFWCAGYVLYGLLCVVTAQPKKNRPSALQTVSVMQPYAPPPKEHLYADVPTAKTGVRLEHALSIADKLLLKNLGKGDRQELEKMKTALTIMQVKGSFTPQEGEILNDNFNALLKLMAKYNL